MGVREFWLKLFLRGETPSDVICVQVEEADTTISDLKRRFLQEIREILPGQTALPWISLTLPPSPFSDGLDPAQTLDSSQELSELPEGAGTKKWHMHAEVRLLGDMGPPVDRTLSPQVRPNRGNEGRPLYERGLAGRDDSDAIKNSLMVPSSQLIPQMLPHQQMAPNQMTPPQMTPLQITTQHMTAQQLTPQQMPAQQMLTQHQQQLAVGQQTSPDQQTQKWIEQQTSRWTEHQGLLLVEARRMEDEKHREQGYRGRSVTASDKWQSVADFLVSQGVVKTREQCRQKWENLMRDFKKIKDYRTPTGHNDYWTMDAAVRKDKKLPGQFSERIFDAMDQFLCERSMSMSMRDSRMQWNPPEDGGGADSGQATTPPNLSGKKRKWQANQEEPNGIDESLVDLIKAQADESRKLQIELTKTSWEKMEKYMESSYQNSEKIVEAMNRLIAALQSKQQPQQQQHPPPA